MLGRREYQKNQMVDGLAVHVVQGFLLSWAPFGRRVGRRRRRGLFLRFSYLCFFYFLP